MSDILQRTNDYFESTRWNQSKLKELNKSLYKYLAYVKRQKERANNYITEEVHNRLGSAADLLLCGGSSVFDRVYYVGGKVKKAPSAAAQNVLHYAKKLVKDKAENEPSLRWGGAIDNAKLYMLMDSLNPLWIEAMDHANKDGRYYGHYKDEVKRKKMITQFEEYWVDLWEADGKEILSVDEMSTISNIRKSFENWPVYQKYLGDPNRYLVKTQEPFYFEIEGQQLKVLLDFLIVDKIDKVIYIRDLKSTSSPFDKFFYSVYDYGYDFQGAVYSRAVMKIIEKKNANGGNWKFGDYGLWVESTISPFNPSPMEVIFSKDVLNAANVKFEESLQKLSWYQSTDFQVDYVKAQMCKYGITLTGDRENAYNFRTSI